MNSLPVSLQVSCMLFMYFLNIWSCKDNFFNLGNFQFLKLKSFNKFILKFIVDLLIPISFTISKKLLLALNILNTHPWLYGIKGSICFCLLSLYDFSIFLYYRYSIFLKFWVLRWINSHHSKLALVWEAYWESCHISMWSILRK